MGGCHRSYPQFVIIRISLHLQSPYIGVGPIISYVRLLFTRLLQPLHAGEVTSKDNSLMSLTTSDNITVTRLIAIVVCLAAIIDCHLTDHMPTLLFYGGNLSSFALSLSLLPGKQPFGISRSAIRDLQCYFIC